MHISVLCTNEKHPVVRYLNKWKVRKELEGHNVTICSQVDQLKQGEILFLISCSDIVSLYDRRKFKHVLVLHASDLPEGRGWSPHIWDILNGCSEITLSLIEASDKIDTGDIWKKISIPIPKYMLWYDINNALFKGEIELMNWAIRNITTVVPLRQDLHATATYWPKRTKNDSYISTDKTLAEQFDLLRVCDPDRYPAYFEIYGRKYKLRLEYYDE